MWSGLKRKCQYGGVGGMTSKSITQLSDLVPDDRNANTGTPRGRGMVETSLQKYGAGRSVLVDRNGKLIAGNKTSEAAAAIGLDKVQVVQTDGSTLVVVQRTDLDLDEDTAARELAIADNRSGELGLEWNTAVLTELGNEIDLSTFWTKDEIAALLEQETPESGGGDEDTEPNDMMPDALFSTDNEWGIPTLDLAMQATTADLPIERWGRMARHGTVSMGGTWHFYTEDYKFQALWDDPAPVPASGCINAIEPNWSTHTAMPAALALYRTYQKRYMARWWQMSGVRILVDLNVEPAFDVLNLIGVPQGWKAYATRAYDTMLDDTPRQWEIACTYAGTDDLLFVVLGGGKNMQRMCGERGWVWIPQENHVVEGRYGTGE